MAMLMKGTRHATRGTVSGSVFTEDTPQRTTYTYEGTNSGYSSATNGRVSQVTYQGPHGLSFVEMYSYVNAGGVSKKRVQITGTPFGSSTVNMDAGYTYDGEGRVLSTTYPGSQYNSNGTVSGGANYNYSYDTLGRLQAMSDSVSNTTWVSGVTYGPADEMLSMTANGFTETRTYNANLQLTDLISGANVHLKYNYSASQNNGQILSQDDLVSGESIGYQYDSLKRLTQANAIGDPSGSWQQNFGYDGFGNLTNKTSTNAPQLSVAVDWATNRIQSFASYDNNGNMTGYAGDVYSYDLQNRMIQASVSGGGTVRYGYDTTNHRVYKGGYNIGTTTYSAEEFYFYGAEGRKYGTWQINPSSGVLLQASVTKQWFGGRLVSPEDRLGSKGRYFAFGEERTNISPANPANDQEKFATYTRDSATGLDYANQRYFNSIIGRFTRPDPYGSSANPTDPQSWNRFSYVGNDPANAFDPEGTCSEYTSFGTNGYSATVNGCVSGIELIPTAPSPFQYQPSGSTSTPPLIAGLPDPTICDIELPPSYDNISNLAVENEVAEARNFYNTAVNVYNPLFNSDSNGSAIFQTDVWLAEVFRPEGKFDLKFQYRTTHPGIDTLTDPGYAAARTIGNFAFGAALESIGFSLIDAQRAAGIAQTLICASGGDCGNGNVFSLYPFGDQYSDALEIKKGFDYQTAQGTILCPKP